MLCLSRSPGLLNRRPRGPLCWVMAFFTASYQHLLRTSTHQGPKAPSAWCGFPYHISSISPSPTGTGTLLTSVLTELYNSSTPTQLPTRSLKAHVWSSSSGNNWHAVHRSLSSGASVYECTMGIFSLSHFVSQFPPMQFPLITTIRMCHFLPVHHLEQHFWSGQRSKYNNTKDFKNGTWYLFYIHDLQILNKMEKKINTSVDTRTFNLLYIYLYQWYLERIHTCAPTVQTIHILFHEQAVYRRGTKMAKSLLDERK